MSHDAAAEAAERKRVMEAVAVMLAGALHAWRNAECYDRQFVELVESAITELRTPVGREKNQ